MLSQHHIFQKNGNKKAKNCLRLLEKTWYVTLSKRQSFYVINWVNHLWKNSVKCFIIFSYWPFKLLVQVFQCLWCSKFWMRCILMIFIIRNGLLILVFITIKIIRSNIFKSFFPSFFITVNQFGIYLARDVVTWSSNVMKSLTVMSSSRNWLRNVANSSSISLSFQVLLASDFLNPHFWS